jgi:uncharacterized protein YbjT (DUF2867 family)
MRKITVFGATGMLGKPVVREFVNSGFEVTALARNLEKARRELPGEVKILEGDIQNKADVERALESAEAVYLNLAVAQDSKPNDFQPERDGLKIILDAARAFNIKRVGYLASIIIRHQGANGFQWWVFDIKLKAVEMIKASGIPYTIFYPSGFMENLDQGNYKQGNKLMLAGESRFPMYFIAGEDYGKQVSRAFQLTEAANRDYDVQGLEAFTADEAARVFAENYTKEKLKISKAPLLVLKIAGLFNQKMNYGAKIVEALNNYEEKFTSETTWKELGKPTVTLAEYARKS